MQRLRGFTLIELMIVVAIVGILATLAIGYNTDWRRKNNFNKATRDMFRLLNTAHSQAIYRGRTVSVHLTENGVMRAFLDANNNHLYDEGETLVTTSATLTLPTGLTASTSDTAAKIDDDIAISFDFEGLCRDASGNSLGMSLLLSDSQLNYQQSIQITVAGAMRIQKVL